MPLVKLEKPEWKKVDERYIIDMMYTDMQRRWVIYKTSKSQFMGHEESREHVFYGEWFICKNGYTPTRAWIQNISPFDTLDECLEKMNSYVDEAFNRHNNPKVVHISYPRREPVVIGGIKIE
jgi:hypothetical protein